MSNKKFLKNQKLMRRDFLIGSGTIIALPFLESLYLNKLHAQSNSSLRVLFGHIDVGVFRNLRAKKALDSRVLQPLQGLSSNMTVFEGVHNEGGANHNQTVPNFSTGGSGTSFDFHAHDIAGKGSRGTPIYVSAHPETNGGGWFRVSRFNSSALKPLYGLNDILSTIVKAGSVPVSNTNVDKFSKMKQSSLHYIVDSMKSLQRKLSSSDKIVLDRHLSLIEEVEKVNNTNSQPRAEAPLACSTLAGVSDSVNLRKRYELLADMIAMGFSCGTRNVIAASIGSYRVNPGYENAVPSYKALVDKIKANGGFFKNVALASDKDQAKLRPGYHVFTHNYEKNVTNRSGQTFLKVSEIENVMKDLSQFHVSFFARIANNLQKAQDTNGSSILDNSLIYFGGDMGDAVDHNRNKALTVLLGKAGGKIKQGKGVVDLGTKNITAFQNDLLDALGSKNKNKYSNKSDVKGTVGVGTFT